ncbi:MAG TPA: hypothetical protein VKV95_02940 [Terriglobia bacterium]|nr:hypothetical protein [Terriglobia bacterium]
MPRKTISKKKKNYIKYHNDGSIWAKGTMIDGQPEGYWEWFRKEGARMRSGYFAMGKQVGEWTTYDKKGKIYKVTRMKLSAWRESQIRSGRYGSLSPRSTGVLHVAESRARCPCYEPMIAAVSPSTDGFVTVGFCR